MKDKKKHCIFCSKEIDQLDYEYHLTICSNDENISTNKKINQELNSKLKTTKYCILCSNDIDQSEYENHIKLCSNNDENFHDQSENDFSNKYSNCSSKVIIDMFYFVLILNLFFK